MLRRSVRQLCALESHVKSAAAVWNVKFGDRATTKELDFHSDQTAIPMFHVLDYDGNVVNAEHDPKLTKEQCERIMTTMVKQHVQDQVLLDAQRQGRISFYMTGFGEEAAVVGSAAALQDHDEVFCQYREHALLTYRGFTLSQMVSQCMGNVEDAAKGRQMPIHYGSPELHVQTVSSPLATQIPQAAGAGYAFKLDKADRICVCYFGDGSASEGDFHAGVNFAATRGAQTLFFCRNNGFAISTPTKDQYRGDGIIPRGIAYGIPSVRVDGTDALAVYAATAAARKRIVTEGTPAMIETMAYRVGDHSTSDDSSRYRSKDDIEKMDKTFDPVARFERYLVKKDWWSPDTTKDMTKAHRKVIQQELKRQEKLPLYPVETLFEDTTKVPMPRLVQQKEETVAHYERHRAIYDKMKH